MRCRWSVLLLPFLFAAPVKAQGGNSTANATNPPPAAFDSNSAPYPSDDFIAGQLTGGRASLASNGNFPKFIGFMSNPLQNVDPRSLTQVVPIFASAWVSNGSALPDLDAQVYGPAISLALTDRLCVGLNQGGYTFIHVDRNDQRGPLVDRLRGTRGEEFGGTRQGFLNLGGFAQYTLLEDVENQFLATAGVRLVAPCGSYEVFQGKGPAQMAPYLTVGKELGDFHLLATGGYQFPLSSGNQGVDIFYLNAHLDRQFFGWVYPLVEANLNYHTTNVAVDLPTRQGFIDLGNFSSTGNTLTVAAGLNLVLIPDRLEIGGVYVKGVATQRDVDLDAMILKMVLRY